MTRPLSANMVEALDVLRHQELIDADLTIGQRARQTSGGGRATGAVIIGGQTSPAPGPHLAGCIATGTFAALEDRGLAVTVNRSGRVLTYGIVTPAGRLLAEARRHAGTVDLDAIAPRHR